MIRRLFNKDDRGAVVTEYGLTAALLSMAIIAGATATGRNLDQTFCSVGTSLAGAPACPSSLPPGDVVYGGASFSVVQGYFGPQVATLSYEEAVEAFPQITTTGFVELTNDLGDGRQSLTTYFYSSSLYQVQERYAEDGLLLGTRQTYVDGTMTLTQYLSQNGVHTRRVEFDQATGQVVKVENFLADPGIWNQIGP